MTPNHLGLYTHGIKGIVQNHKAPNSASCHFGSCRLLFRNKGPQRNMHPISIPGFVSKSGDTEILVLCLLAPSGNIWTWSSPVPAWRPIGLPEESKRTCYFPLVERARIKTGFCVRKGLKVGYFASSSLFCSCSKKLLPLASHLLNNMSGMATLETMKQIRNFGNSHLCIWHFGFWARKGRL